MVECQFQAKSGECDGAVFGLTAAFGRGCFDTGRFVAEDDGRFDLIAMLSAGSAAPLSPHEALSEQCVITQGGRMNVVHGGGMVSQWDGQLSAVVFDGHLLDKRHRGSGPGLGIGVAIGGFGEAALQHIRIDDAGVE